MVFDIQFHEKYADPVVYYHSADDVTCMIEESVDVRVDESEEVVQCELSLIHEVFGWVMASPQT